MANMLESRDHACATFHACLPACLVETSRPLLVTPRNYKPRKLDRILTGWRDTPPGRRALKAAEPWLRRVGQVRLVCINSPDPHELTWAR